MNIMCLICSELMNEEEVLHVTKCGHVFHYDCLHTLLLSSRRCPECRYKVKETKLIRLFPSVLEGTSEEDPILQWQANYFVLRTQEMAKMRDSFIEVKKKFASLMWFSLGFNLMLGLINYFYR